MITAKSNVRDLRWYHWLGVAFFCLCISTVMKLCSGPSASDSKVSNGPMAYAHCETYVKDFLKAPSTAEFSGLESQIVAQGNNRYAVIGWVDSQNAFGVKMRTDFGCTATDMGNDQWSFEPLVIHENE